MTPALFTPLQVRGVTFANRVAVSPMAQYSAIAGVAQPWHLQHLGSLAVSGPGMVMIESTAVDPLGCGSKTCLALFNDAQEAGLAHVIQGLRSFSQTPLGIQIGHSGRKASACDPSQGRRPLSPAEGAWQTVAPSSLSFSNEWPVPRAFDADSLKQTQRAFQDAATRAARLNLDVLELHGAHGYLLHSFLSPISNQRNDEYGGTLAKRMRFVVETMEKARAAFPADRVVGIRLNHDDWQAEGMSLEDTIQIVQRLKEVGCDYVCVSAGAISGASRVRAAPSYLVPFASRIRRETGITTFVTGMIAHPQEANRVIAEGHADMVVLARAFLDDPRWVWHAAEQLGVTLDYPMQYQLAHPSAWKRADLYTEPLKHAVNISRE